MWYLDTAGEIQVVNQRIEDARKEIAGLRLGASQADRRLRARLDAGIVRLTSGAARRHSDRQSRRAA